MNATKPCFIVCSVMMACSVTCKTEPQLPGASTTSNRPTLAVLQIPDQTLLLYENMTVKDPDRTGNWRFRFSTDGCFFHSRNTQLWIKDSKQFSSNDPTLFWNTPFSEKPQRCLNQAQQSVLAKAIQKADFPSLDSYYSSQAKVSSPSVERWTVNLEKKTFTVTVEKGSAPPGLIELRATIDQLIANAPLQDNKGADEK